MILHSKKVRALGLCSGGLDSILAALILHKQNIEVEWVTFETPFFSSEKAKKSAHATKIPLTVCNITSIYLKMLKNPPCGYGRNMNPCMDCHALMFRLAGKIMRERNFDFLFSGEVLGQRPMSQTKSSLRYVEKNSGFDGFILRPLSAKRLPATIPEKKKLVSRELLYDIAGRSRKPQITLAVKFGVTDYPAGAGGCLLTDQGFAARLRDLFEHQDTYTEKELHLLKHGRHIRLDKNTKIIIGRNKKDNENLIEHHNPATDTVIKIENFPGPTVIVPGSDSKSITKAASICVGYSKAPEQNKQIDVVVISPSGTISIKVVGTLPNEIGHLII